MLEDEESSEEKVLDELMLFEEPSEGLPLQQGIERKGGEGYGSTTASHQLRPVDSNALKKKMMRAL